MSAFKLPSIWQEDVAKNLSKLFSSNKSAEEDNPAGKASEIESPKSKQTAVSPKDRKTDAQTFSGSANKLFTGLAKVFQGSVDQENSSAQEKPTASEDIALLPFGILNQPEDGIRQKLGSFFSRTPKSKPDKPLTLSQSKSVSSPDLNTENQYGTQISNQNDDPEKEPFSKQITLALDSDPGENGRKTLETSYPETLATEQTFVQTELVERNKSETARPKAIGFNTSTSAQYKESGSSEGKLNDSACTTDPIDPQKLQKLSGSISLEKNVGSVRTDTDAVDQKTLPKLQAVICERKESNRQVLEDGANETDSSENEQDLSVPPIITYSTYCGARRIRRKRSQRKPFQPQNPTISEVDEKSVISLVDQTIMNPMKEETNHGVILQAATMTGIQTPLETKVSLINHGKGNNELQPRNYTEKFPSNKLGLVEDAKTENETLMQQSSCSGVSREIEINGSHHQEPTKVGSACSPVTTGTINSTKKQILESDASVSNTTGIQKIAAVNLDNIDVPSTIVTPEDLHSKESGVPEMGTHCAVQKDNLITNHNNLSHKDEVYADITTGEITAQNDISPKTTIIMNSDQEPHVPSALKTISKKGTETDVPKANCFTVDAVETATTQKLKPVNSNNVMSLTETGQQADNTHGLGKDIVANSAEDRALTVPVITGSKLDDMEKETEKTEPVGKSEKQGLMLEILDNATAAQTKMFSLRDPVKTIHTSNEVDTTKVIPNETCDKYDVQLEIASRTQTNGHTTVSDTFEMFNIKGGIPDVSTNDMPKKYKSKDNVIGLSTESLTTDTGYAIEKLSKEYSQTIRRKSVPEIIRVNEESSSEALQKQMSKNSSMLTTVEVINETRTEDIATSANVTNESTIVIENDKHLKISSSTVSTMATDTAPSTMQSDGVSNSEATITTEPQEIPEASNVQTDKSLYIKKTDQVFKMSSEKHHDDTSELLQCTQASLFEPKVSRAAKPFLANESVFFRYYQESTYLLLDSDKNTCSIANSEIVTVPAFKQNQLVEEIQGNRKASNFVTAQKDDSESSMGTSSTCSPSENNLWYRCFQQSTGLLNVGENTQPNIINERTSGNTQTDEIVPLTKPVALVANSAEEAIQGTLQGDALNNFRMSYSNQQNEEMVKRIKTYDSKDSNTLHSVKPEGEETAIKIKEKKEQITLQSGEELIKLICAVDASQVHPVETMLSTDSGDTSEGKTKKLAEEMISSARQVTSHTQLSTTFIKEDITTVETGSDVIKSARLMDNAEDADLNESTNNLAVNNTIEEGPEELVKTLQVNGERVNGVVQSEIPEESENNSICISGGEDKASPLKTHENVSKYVPSIHRADEKDVSMMMEPCEESINSAPLLPMDLAHPVKDAINQEAGTGLLNLTSTSHAIGFTETALRTDQVKVNDGQIRAQDPTKETEDRTELRKIVVAAEDSLPEAPSEMIKTDQQNSEPMAQECSAIVTEQCNIIDPAQSTAVLRTDSAKSTKSNDTQENLTLTADFEKNVTNSEEENNFQPGSVQLTVSKCSLSADQRDSTNQNTKSEEVGTGMLSKIQRSSSISLSVSVKPVNEMAKRMIQKIVLSAQEAVANIQITDTVQLPLSDSGPATESNMTLPSETKSGAELVTFTETVTPHIQPSSIVTTIETGPDEITSARLMDNTEDVGLNESTNNLTVNNTIEEEPEEFVKTIQINGERVKAVVQNNSMCISGGEDKASPLKTHENVSEYVPSIHRADEKDVSMMMEPCEESINSAPLLPMDLAHPVKDAINQEAGTGLLNLTSTSHAIGITETALRTDQVKVNDGQIRAQDPTKETEDRTELRKIVVAADDSLPEAPSEMIKTDQQNSEPMAQECSAIVTEQCNIIDPAQSTAVLRTDSALSTQSNDTQENVTADFEKSKSSQLADQGNFANESMENVEEDETERIPEPQINFDILVACSTNIPNSHVTESLGTINHHVNNENEMEPQFVEQEALILDTPLRHNFKRRKIYPFALPPIYEEQNLENDATMDTNNITHSPTSTTLYDSNQPVTSVLEHTAASLHLMQTENIVEEVGGEEENPPSPGRVLEVSTTLSSDHLDKSTTVSQSINEEQNLSLQLQMETCAVDSKASPKPMSSVAVDSVFYRYFQSSRNHLPKDEQASPECAAEMLTLLQEKSIEESNQLKCPADSKCLVKNKNLKINPRPGKMVIYDGLNFHGNKREIFTDVADATSWNFSEGISLKVVRGCWILYEKPEFQGQTYILEEGQRELDELWVDESLQMESTTTKIVIGSIKRIVKVYMFGIGLLEKSKSCVSLRKLLIQGSWLIIMAPAVQKLTFQPQTRINWIAQNHCIPEIAIFQESQQDDMKAYLHNEVTCIKECEITPTISSIIINSGIWLAYIKANFSGRFTLLETGSSPVPISTEVKSNSIKSLRPLKMGGLKVERPLAPKVIIFEKTFFNGHFREICKDASDLKNLWEDVTDLNIDDFRGVGSIRVIGGVWVCYEKECYRGHQYLLEEGEYEDWQAWGGFDSTVQSMRYIQADYMKPEIVLFEEADLKNGNSISVNHDIPNLTSIEYGTVTRSIKVKNGVWVAYHEEYYSGEQYILEKGMYRDYTDWGGNDSSIMSIRPIQLEPVGGNEAQFQLRAHNGIDFQGQSVEFVTAMPSLSSLQPNSFKVLRGCWVLYDEKDYGGCQYVLEEGHYPDLDSLGCLSTKPIQSLKPISNDFSMPSISLFSLYSFEGQELILTEGTSCLKDKGYYQSPKSVKVNNGIWIAYEHANFRGKQLLLEHTEITNWNKFSGWKTIGSVYPLRQPRVYFRIKNKATGGFLTVSGDHVGSILSVCPYNGKTTQMWFYCDGLISSKANYACIDVTCGQTKAGAKVNLWPKHRRTHQKWNINRDGTISFLDFNLRLDIKGGSFYDKDRIILNLPEEQKQTQFWDIEVLI